MRLTERDKRIVKAVNDFRIMRQDQVERLHFTSATRAQKRLWLLWQHSFLKRQFLPVLGGVQNSPILYLVDRPGVKLLQREFDYTKDDLRYSKNNKLSNRFLKHTLGLSEIRLSVELSCRRHDFVLEVWRDEKWLKQNYDYVQTRRKSRVPVLPDSYFKIKVGQTPIGKSIHLHFFLEYDRSLENLAFFRRKIETYWAYFYSGKCKERYGTNRIRVLTVTEGGISHKGRGRLKSVQDVTKGLGDHTWFWFTSQDKVMREDFLTAPIWEQTHTEEPGALFGAD
jgi:hypothetical protein